MKDFFKRIFGKLFKRKSKKHGGKGAWYNDAHEKPRGLWSTPAAPGEPWSDNSVDTAETMKWAKN